MLNKLYILIINLVSVILKIIIKIYMKYFELQKPELILWLKILKKSRHYRRENLSDIEYIYFAKKSLKDEDLIGIFFHDYVLDNKERLNELFKQDHIGTRNILLGQAIKKRNNFLNIEKTKPIEYFSK